jgi:molybdate transport system substrate-binding protein
VDKKAIVPAALGAAGFLMLASVAGAAEIKVLASNAIKEAYLELAPQFEKASENKVVTTWAGTIDIMKRMAAGETYDLVIMAGPSIDELVKQGKIVSGSRVDLVKSGVGVAVRAGAPKPDISSGDALKKTLLSAKSVGLSTGPSGVYVADLLQRMGIADEIKPKLKQTAPGVPVGTIVASGEAEIGFQQVSELIHVPGIDYIGPLPADVQHITVFSAGIHSGTKEPDAAKALVKFITAPTAVPVIKKHGLEPG